MGATKRKTLGHTSQLQRTEPTRSVRHSRQGGLVPAICTGEREDLLMAASRSRRSSAVAAMVGLVALLVAACGSPTPPATFSHRTKLPDCGSGPVRIMSDADAATLASALDCFARARMSGTGAEVHLRAFSIEGARSDRWLRTLPDGTVEDFGHTEGDEFGADHWTYARCASLTRDSQGLPLPVDCARSYP